MKNTELTMKILDSYYFDEEDVTYDWDDKGIIYYLPNGIRWKINLIKKN